VDTRKSVSIVIPNYNGRHLLQEYLPVTFEVATEAEIVYEIIIVDDNSNDESVEFIKSVYPEVNLVVNPESMGLSYSYNRGIEIARYELILLLNADVKLSSGYFEQQWKYFLRWDTFGVMGRIVDLEGDHIQTAARAPEFDGFKVNTPYSHYTDNEMDRLYTFYLSAANALISAEKLKKIGGFSELFSPFYFDDRELSVRAWRLNWKCYYENQAICRRPAPVCNKDQWYYHNSYFFHAVHLDGFNLFGWHVQTIFADVLPKLFSGRMLTWKSYQAIFINNAAIKRYKLAVKKLMVEHDSRLRLPDVIKKISVTIKNKKITRFKSGLN
jgi:GT2 family glycosyltransferase